MEEDLEEISDTATENEKEEELVIIDEDEHEEGEIIDDGEQKDTQSFCGDGNNFDDRSYYFASNTNPLLYPARRSAMPTNYTGNISPEPDICIESVVKPLSSEVVIYNDLGRTAIYSSPKKGGDAWDLDRYSHYSKGREPEERERCRRQKSSFREETSRFKKSRKGTSSSKKLSHPKGKALPDKERRGKHRSPSSSSEESTGSSHSSCSCCVISGSNDVIDLFPSKSRGKENKHSSQERKSESPKESSMFQRYFKEYHHKTEKSKKSPEVYTVSDDEKSHCGSRKFGQPQLHSPPHRKEVRRSSPPVSHLKQSKSSKSPVKTGRPRSSNLKTSIKYNSPLSKRSRGSSGKEKITKDIHLTKRGSRSDDRRKSSSKLVELADLTDIDRKIPAPPGSLGEMLLKKSMKGQLKVGPKGNTADVRNSANPVAGVSNDEKEHETQKASSCDKNDETSQVLDEMVINLDEEDESELQLRRIALESTLKVLNDIRKEGQLIASPEPCNSKDVDGDHFVMNKDSLSSAKASSSDLMTFGESLLLSLFKDPSGNFVPFESKDDDNGIFAKDIQPCSSTLSGNTREAFDSNQDIIDMEICDSSPEEDDFADVVDVLKEVGEDISLDWGTSVVNQNDALKSQESHQHNFQIPVEWAYMMPPPPPPDQPDNDLSKIDNWCYEQNMYLQSMQSFSGNPVEQVTSYNATLDVQAGWTDDNTQSREHVIGHYDYNNDNKGNDSQGHVSEVYYQDHNYRNVQDITDNLLNLPRIASISPSGNAGRCDDVSDQHHIDQESSLKDEAAHHYQAFMNAVLQNHTSKKEERNLVEVNLVKSPDSKGTVSDKFLQNVGVTGKERTLVQVDLKPHQKPTTLVKVNLKPYKKPTTLTKAEQIRSRKATRAAARRRKKERKRLEKQKAKELSVAYQKETSLINQVGELSLLDQMKADDTEMQKAVDDGNLAVDQQDDDDEDLLRAQLLIDLSNKKSQKEKEEKALHASLQILNKHLPSEKPKSCSPSGRLGLNSDHLESSPPCSFPSSAESSPKVTHSKFALSRKKAHHLKKAREGSPSQRLDSHRLPDIGGYGLDPKNSRYALAAPHDLFVRKDVPKFKFPPIKPIIINAGTESTDEEEEEYDSTSSEKKEVRNSVGPKKSEAVGLGSISSFTSNLDSLLKSMRAKTSTASKPLTTSLKASKSTTTTKATPTAVRHLSRTKQAEYIRLKEQLREKEKLRHEMQLQSRKASSAKNRKKVESNKIGSGVESNKQGSVVKSNKQGSGVESNKQGSGVESNKQGSGVEPNKQGSGVESNKQGSVVKSNKQGSWVESNKQGSGVESNKQGSVVKSNKQGSGVEPNKQGSGVESKKQSSGVESNKQGSGVEPNKQGSGVESNKQGSGVEPNKQGSGDESNKQGSDQPPASLSKPQKDDKETTTCGESHGNIVDVPTNESKADLQEKVDNVNISAAKMESEVSNRSGISLAENKSSTVEEEDEEALRLMVLQSITKKRLKKPNPEKVLDLGSSHINNDCVAEDKNMVTGQQSWVLRKGQKATDRVTEGQLKDGSKESKLLATESEVKMSSDLEVLKNTNEASFQTEGQGNEPSGKEEIAVHQQVEEKCLQTELRKETEVEDKLNLQLEEEEKFNTIEKNSEVSFAFSDPILVSKPQMISKKRPSDAASESSPVSKVLKTENGQKSVVDSLEKVKVVDSLELNESRITDTNTIEPCDSEIVGKGVNESTANYESISPTLNGVKKPRKEAETSGMLENYAKKIRRNVGSTPKKEIGLGKQQKLDLWDRLKKKYIEKRIHTNKVMSELAILVQQATEEEKQRQSLKQAIVKLQSQLTKMEGQFEMQSNLLTSKMEKIRKLQNQMNEDRQIIKELEAKGEILGKEVLGTGYALPKVVDSPKSRQTLASNIIAFQQQMRDISTKAKLQVAMLPSKTHTKPNSYTQKKYEVSLYKKKQGNLVSSNASKGNPKTASQKSLQVGHSFQQSMSNKTTVAAAGILKRKATSSAGPMVKKLPKSNDENQITGVLASPGDSDVNTTDKTSGHMNAALLQPERKKLDEMNELCPYDLLGRCNDDSCVYQHLDHPRVKRPTTLTSPIASHSDHPYVKRPMASHALTTYNNEKNSSDKPEKPLNKESLHLKNQVTEGLTERGQSVDVGMISTNILQEVQNDKEQPKNSVDATSKEQPKNICDATAKEQPKKGVDATSEEQSKNDGNGATSKEQPKVDGDDATSEEQLKNIYDTTAKEQPKNGNDATSKEESKNGGNDATSKELPKIDGDYATSKEQPKYVCDATAKEQPKNDGDDATSKEQPKIDGATSKEQPKYVCDATSKEQLNNKGDDVTSKEQLKNEIDDTNGSFEFKVELHPKEELGSKTTSREDSVSVCNTADGEGDIPESNFSSLPQKHNDITCSVSASACDNSLKSNEYLSSSIIGLKDESAHSIGENIIHPTEACAQDVLGKEENCSSKGDVVLPEVESVDIKGTSEVKNTPGSFIKIPDCTDSRYETAVDGDLKLDNAPLSSTNNERLSDGDNHNGGDNNSCTDKEGNFEANSEGIKTVSSNIETQRSEEVTRSTNPNESLDDIPIDPMELSQNSTELENIPSDLCGSDSDTSEATPDSHCVQRGRSGRRVRRPLASREVHVCRRGRSRNLGLESSPDKGKAVKKGSPRQRGSPRARRGKGRRGVRSGSR